MATALPDLLSYGSTSPLPVPAPAQLLELVIDMPATFRPVFTVPIEQTADRKGAALLVLDTPLSQLASPLSAADIAELWTAPLVADPKCMVWNRECTMHRRMGLFAGPGIEGYRFAGQLMPSQPLTPLMQRLLDLFGSLTGGTFNALLFNHYRDKNDYLSAHSDDQKYLSDQGVIALSLGASRTFRVTYRKGAQKDKVAVDHRTADGEILWMAGRAFQELFKHAILKGDGARLSITARHHTA